MVILGSPQISGPIRFGGNRFGLWAPVANKQYRIPEHDSRDPETETGKLEIEKRVHRIHETLETGLHKDPLQPGGPLKGGQWIEDVSAMQLCNFSCQAEWLKNLKKNGRIISSNAVG